MFCCCCLVTDNSAANGSVERTPALKYWEESVAPAYIRRQIGLPATVTAEAMAALLSKMGLVSRVHNEQIISRVPPTRHDILHPCDIMEDVAVAYDFNKVCVCDLTHPFIAYVPIF